MSKQFIPRPHQQVAIPHLMKYDRCALWMPMRFGKSSTALTALENLKLIDDVYPVLIIAPFRVANDAWPSEIEKWSHLNHLKVSVILGNPDERIRSVRRPADIYTINPENLVWLVNMLKDKWCFKTIIYDESSKLSGFRLRQGTKRAQALSKVAFKSKRFWQLTGTPSSNGLSKLWGQLWFIDQGQRLGKTYTAFVNRWFKESYDGFSIEPMPHAQKEIEDLIKDVCLSIDPKKYFPVEEPIKEVIPVKLPPDVLRQYKKLEKEFFVDLGQHQIEPLNAAAKSNKLLQFASGAVYVEDKRWVQVHDEKIKALESIIEEANGTPVLCVYNFVADLDRLKKHFPGSKVLDKSAQTVKDWNAGKIQLLFIHPASAGHGIDLAQGGNILVFFSPNWNLEENLQVSERNGPAGQKQAGLDRPVFVYYILAEGTIDYLVMERLKSKRSVQDLLLEAMAKQNVDID